MKARDHQQILREIHKRHREEMAAEVAERERACAALRALYTEELELTKTERDEWERMYHEAVAMARKLKGLAA